MLYRDSPQDRLGIRFASTTPEDPPFVKAITGVAQHSDLKVNDIILKVDGKDASNSGRRDRIIQQGGHEHRAGSAPAAEHHAVMMNRRESAAAATKTLVIARNDVGLGLIVDSDNTISDLRARLGRIIEARRLPDRPKDRRRERHASAAKLSSRRSSRPGRIR